MHRMVRIIVVLLALCAPGVRASSETSPPASALAKEAHSAFTPERVAQANDYLDRLAAIGFRGAVLVAAGDDVLVSRGYGPIGPAGEKNIGPETIFAIGSNTKPFTAAAILKLQDQGKLKVTDSIARFLPDVPADKQAITIDHLLTHSAGFNHSGIFAGDFEQVDRDEAVRRILGSDLLFLPGSESSYDDVSMTLLAAITEIASGDSYETYLREELFAPAAMTHTGFHGDDAATLGSPLATGVVEGEITGTATDLPAPDWALKGAGGMVSTVDDLYRWHEAVTSGKILSQQSQEAYFAPHVPLDETAAEGYGWVVAEPVPEHRVVASAGGTDEIGQVNVIQWWTDDDLVVIVSSADAAHNAEDVAAGIDHVMFGLPQALPPAMAAVDPNALHATAGNYALPDGGEIIVSATNDRLLFSPEGEAAYTTLYPPGEKNDEQSDPEATIAYLESGQDSGLDAWKAEQAATLGPFQRMTVVGNASAEGSGELWTYVAFEFANGNVLTRWIVNADGVLGAASLPSEPPTRMFLPTAPETFTSFAMSNSNAFTATFSVEASGARTLHLTAASGKQITAIRQAP